MDLLERRFTIIPSELKTALSIQKLRLNRLLERLLTVIPGDVKHVISIRKLGLNRLLERLLTIIPDDIKQVLSNRKKLTSIDIWKYFYQYSNRYQIRHFNSQKAHPRFQALLSIHK